MYGLEATELVTLDCLVAIILHYHAKKKPKQPIKTKQI